MTDDIRLETLTLEHIPQAHAFAVEAFGSKRCMGVFPCYESAKEMKRRYESYPAEKLELGVVAILDNQVVGHLQMTRKGLPVYPEELHTCKPGEMYIETICVAASARGKGIGKQLMEWSRQKAVATPGITMLTLEVLNGNRAQGLYERMGFVSQEQDCVDACCTSAMVFCFLGRPYGWCNPGWGATFMIQKLGDSGE